MKWIKEFRVFESEELSLRELFDLGIISQHDIAQAAKSPEEAGELLIWLARTGQLVRSIDFVSHVMQLTGSSDQLWAKRVYDYFMERVEDEVVEPTLDKLNGLDERTCPNDRGEYWVDPDSGKVIMLLIRVEPNMIFVNFDELFKPLSDSGYLYNQIESKLLIAIRERYDFNINKVAGVDEITLLNYING